MFQFLGDCLNVHAVARGPRQGEDPVTVGMQEGADQHQVVLLIARLLLFVKYFTFRHIYISVSYKSSTDDLLAQKCTYGYRLVL